MKKLQNTFTTPEQSKRLLELGVPADSADCFYDKHFFGSTIVQTRMGSDWRKSHDLFSGVFKDVITPCWSVGRLIEIIMRCHKYGILFFSSIRIYKTDILNNTLIDDLIKYMPEMDFSKLED